MNYETRITFSNLERKLIWLYTLIFFFPLCFFTYTQVGHLTIKEVFIIFFTITIQSISLYFIFYYLKNFIKSNYLYFILYLIWTILFIHLLEYASNHLWGILIFPKNLLWIGGLFLFVFRKVQRLQQVLVFFLLFINFYFIYSSIIYSKKQKFSKESYSIHKDYQRFIPLNILNLKNKNMILSKPSIFIFFIEKSLDEEVITEEILLDYGFKKQTLVFKAIEDNCTSYYMAQFWNYLPNETCHQLQKEVFLGDTNQFLNHLLTYIESENPILQFYKQNQYKTIDYIPSTYNKTKPAIFDIRTDINGDLIQETLLFNSYLNYYHIHWLNKYFDRKVKENLRDLNGYNKPLLKIRSIQNFFKTPDFEDENEERDMDPIQEGNIETLENLLTEEESVRENKIVLFIKIPSVNPSELDKKTSSMDGYLYYLANPTTEEALSKVSKIEDIMRVVTEVLIKE